MANNRQDRRKMHQKVDSMSSSFSFEIGKVVKIFIVIILFFVFFYFLTVFILEKGDSSSIIDTKPAAADIQYQEILAGNSFSMSDDSYYVLYYDMSDERLKSIYTAIVTTYEEQENHDFIYTVDMSSAFNNKYVSDTANLDVESIDDLKISGPTLIEIQNGGVVSYTEGQEAITEKLS